MEKIVLAPSLLSADFSNLENALNTIEKNNGGAVHIDVMDGRFVPQITYGQPVVKSLRALTQLPFDVHLMVQEPLRFVREFKECGADLLTVHAEACTHLHTTVTEIKKLGMKAGVALNPATPAESLRYVLPELDYVLVMTVNPGFGGQKFLPSMLDKIRSLHKLMGELGVKADVEVDGGITLQNVREVMDDGANWFVAGTSVFGGDIKQNAAGFKTAFGNEDKCR